MQAVNANFQAGHQRRGFSHVNVDFGKSAPVVEVHQSTAENDAVIRKQASPKIRKIRGVKGFWRCQPYGRELCGSQRRGRQGQGEFRERAAREAAYLQGLRVGGENGAVRSNLLASCVQTQRLIEF